MSTDGCGIRVGLDMRMAIRKLKVINNGINLIIGGLEEIDRGCPDCGEITCDVDSFIFPSSDQISGICSDCKLRYTVRRSNK